MKNALFIIICSILLGTSVSAETRFGILAGVSNSNFIDKSVTTGTDYVVVKMHYTDYGVHAGGFFELTLGTFVFQPELYLSSITNVYKISNPDPLAAVNNVYKNDRTFNLEMPVLFGVKVGPARFMLGPSGRLVMYNLNQLKDYTNYDVQLNRALWSIQTALGLEIEHFQVNLKYEFGLSKIASGITVDGIHRTFDSRANQILLTAGWAF